MKLNDKVKLLIDLPDEGLKEGDEGTIVHVYDIVHDSPSGYEVEFDNGNVVCLNGHHIALVRPDIPLPAKPLIVIPSYGDYEEDSLNTHIVVYTDVLILNSESEIYIRMDDIEEWLRLARPHLFKESKIDPLIEGIGNLDLINSFTV